MAHIRVSESVYESLKERARIEKRTLSAVVEMLLAATGVGVVSTNVDRPATVGVDPVNTPHTAVHKARTGVAKVTTKESAAKLGNKFSCKAVCPEWMVAQGKHRLNCVEYQG